MDYTNEIIDEVKRIRSTNPQLIQMAMKSPVHSKLRNKEPMLHVYHCLGSRGLIRTKIEYMKFIEELIG